MEPVACASKQISLDTSKNIVLIDTSYYVFFRYYATLFWFQKQSKDAVNISEILNNETFMAKFDKTFETTLMNIKKGADTDWSNVVFVKDCPRERIWRLKYYPEYKGTRSDKNDTFNGDIFKHVFSVLLPKLQKTVGAFHTIMYDHAEADDIVAVIAKNAKKKNQNCNLYITTDDNDYIQLHQDGVFIKNLKNKVITERMQEMDVTKFLLTKIILGDKSDNITSIAKKCGPKTAEKLLADPAVFNAFVNKSEDVKAKYLLNKKLIDFNEIPTDISEGIESCIVLR